MLFLLANLFILILKLKIKNTGSGGYSIYKSVMMSKLEHEISTLKGSRLFWYTSTNKSHHESTRINRSPTRDNTNKHKSSTSQHEFDTSQHNWTQVQNRSGSGKISCASVFYLFLKTKAFHLNYFHFH